MASWSASCLVQNATIYLVSFCMVRAGSYSCSLNKLNTIFSGYSELSLRRKWMMGSIMNYRFF